MQQSNPRRPGLSTFEEHKSRTLHLVHKTLHKLSENPGTRLDTDLLLHLGVHMGRLDLETGEPRGDNGPRFIRPRRHDDLRRMLARAGDPKAEFSFDSYANELWRARHTWTYLKQQLTFIDDPKTDSLAEQLGLTVGLQRRGDRLYGGTFRDKSDWNVDGIIEDPGKSHPHRTCFLASNVTIQDDKLSTSELACILATLAGRVVRPGWEKFRVVPTTIVSSSDTKIRVVQGYADLDTKRIIVRMTETVDLAVETPPEDKLMDFLAWLAGEFVGA